MDALLSVLGRMPRGSLARAPTCLHSSRSDPNRARERLDEFVLEQIDRFVSATAMDLKSIFWSVCWQKC
jgi:hypothetical protein